MDESRKKILEMLSEGKITVDEATALLEKVAAVPEAPAPPVTVVEGGSASTETGANPRFLRVVVDSSDGDKVNVRIPLALVRTGIKLTAVLPNNVNETLGEKGVDLSKLGQLDGDELVEALRELQVDVDSSDGDTVRVFCE